MLHRINIKKFRAWHTESTQQKKEPSYMVDRNVNWCSHYGKHYRQTFLQKVKIVLFYDPVTWLLGIYPNKPIIPKDTCTPMFIAALYIITKTRKQPKCPSSDEWIKMQCIYTQQNIACVKSLHIWLFVSPRSVAHQVPLSMESAGNNTGMGCHFLLQLWNITQP